ncbi:MAG: cob(I)yrinic acid a,c-diamide adenosyltransferase [Sphaerochaetaceae bacterium]|jgi:cob(I)alamin adenosyltransferase|nr:cob(I)yrinic acid a,c-diamide adenosyltransferase [Sphaerochaetaceae bacterium]HHU88796.1 cob(I)yrinic acid a,c-diamide adenosyltransferase [Spirochaetales bacterium]
MARIPLLIVYTGDGKGKTTAAMGLLFRALGHGAKCGVVQFIKPDNLKTGEKRSAEHLNVLWENYGEGFLWNQDDIEPSLQAAQKGWHRVKELLKGQELDLLILDELTYILQKGFVSTAEVVQFLSTERGKTHVVVTGRGAPKPLLEAADMVNEVVEIKHPFKEAKIGAQKLIEY